MAVEQANQGSNYTDVAVRLGERFPSMQPFLGNVPPDIQPQMITPLSIIDAVGGKLDTFTLPLSSNSELKELFQKHVQKLLNKNGEKPEESVKKACEFAKGIARLSSYYSRLLSGYDDPDIDQFPDCTDLIGKIHQTLKIVTPGFEYSSYQWNTERQTTFTEAEVLNRFADKTKPVIEKNFSGEESDQSLTHTAGDIFHYAVALNEVLNEKYLSIGEEKNYTRKRIIEQHLALMKNDLSGYHGDSPMETAQDTAWHGRRILEVLNFLSPQENEMMIKGLRELSEHFSSQAIQLFPEDIKELTPSQAAKLVSMKEIDELLLERIGVYSGEYHEVSDHLINTYLSLGLYYEDLGDYEGALSCYRRICELSTKDEKTPRDQALSGLLRTMYERNKILAEGERQVVWGLQINNRLTPFRVSRARNSFDPKVLTAEIALIEEKIREGNYKIDNYFRLASAIIWAVEEPREESLGNLQLLNDKIIQPSEDELDSGIDRLKKIANFLIKGWEDRGSSDTSDDPLSPYKDAAMARSLEAANNFADSLEKSGNALPDGKVATGQAAVRVKVRLPGERHGDTYQSIYQYLLTGPAKDAGGFTAACALGKPSEKVGKDSVTVRLSPKTAKRLKLSTDVSLPEYALEALGVHLPGEQVEVADAYVVVPVVESPHGDQAGFKIELKTATPSRTVVLKEGELVGSFITSREHPSIDLCQVIRESESSNLWEPGLPSRMSKEERDEHGDDAGSFQIISIPVVFSEEGKGGGGDGGHDIIPTPPGGIQLSHANTRYKKPLSALDIEITGKLIMNLVQALRQKQREVVDLTVPETIKPFAENFVDTGNLFGFGYTKGLPDESPMLSAGGSRLAFGGISRSILPSVRPSAQVQKQSAPGRLERAAIRISRQTGSKYGTFQGEIRTDETRTVSVINLTLVGISAQNPNPISNK